MTVSIPLAQRNVGFDWSRLLPGVALFAGLAWLVFGLESIIRPHTEDYRNALFYVPWIPTMAAVYGLHGLRQDQSGSFERWPARGLLAAMTLVVAGQPAFIFDQDWLLPVALVGFLGFMAGTVAFGAALYRAGTVPRALAAGIAGTQIGTMAMGLALSPWVPLADDGSYSGAVVHGVVFTAAGLWLLRREAREVA